MFQQYFTIIFLFCVSSLTLEAPQPIPTHRTSNQAEIPISIITAIKRLEQESNPKLRAQEYSNSQHSFNDDMKATSICIGYARKIHSLKRELLRIPAQRSNSDIAESLTILITAEQDNEDFFQNILDKNESVKKRYKPRNKGNKELTMWSFLPTLSSTTATPTRTHSDRPTRQSNL